MTWKTALNLVFAFNAGALLILPPSTVSFTTPSMMLVAPSLRSSWGDAAVPGEHQGQESHLDARRTLWGTEQGQRRKDAL